MKFTFVVVSAPAVQYLSELDEEFQTQFPGCAEIKMYYAVEEFPAEKTNRMIEDIASADCVLVDLMGSPPRVVQAVERGLDRCQ